MLIISIQRMNDCLICMCMFLFIRKFDEDVTGVETTVTIQEAEQVDYRDVLQKVSNKGQRSHLELRYMSCS